jgi:hypothetical protein
MNHNPDLQNAVSLHQGGRLMEAEMAYQEILLTDNRSLEVYGYLANCQLQQNIMLEAVDTAERGLRLDPLNIDFKQFLCQVYWAAGMKEKADVIVSEILDAGLLGEGVLPSLRHAWQNFLTEDAVCILKLSIFVPSNGPFPRFL